MEIGDNSYGEELGGDVIAVDIDVSEDAGIKIISYMGMENIADTLEKQDLQKIGIKCKEDYDTDLLSMDDWLSEYHDALKLAKQVREKKTFPWVNASNVKVPLIGQAAMQFNARAYPEIIQGDQVVKAKVIGDDPTEGKAARADRISEHMSYQLLDEIPNWERDTDKLLMILPIAGTVFREVGWNEVEQRPFVDLLLPDELIVNINAKSLDLTECRRISKRLTFYKNDIVERERAGLWLERNYTTEAQNEDDVIEKDQQLFIQQLCYLDLDEDGYEEPYQVTFHYESGDVVRIIANYDAATVVIDEQSGDVIRIRPYMMYTDYHFIPSFDGAFYSTGFGSYLYPMNSACDTLINQLIDAGTLSNVQSGFLAKGLRTKAGSTPLQPGEWRPVDTKGVDLQGSILPLPAKDPSPTLFSLLQLLINMGKEMSSVTDVLAGVPQGVNTPVGTTLAMIEQGMKVLDAVYKRVYLALKREFQMLYRVNSIYLLNDIYQNILDTDLADVSADYKQGDFDIVPVGDTRISSQIMRTMKAQSALELATKIPGADLRAAGMRALKAMDIPNPEEIIPELPPADVLIQQLQQLQGYADTMTQQMQALVAQINSSENARKDAELMIKAEESAATVAGKYADTAKKLAETEAMQMENGLNRAIGINMIEQAAVGQILSTEFAG